MLLLRGWLDDCEVCDETSDMRDEESVETDDEVSEDEPVDDKSMEASCWLVLVKLTDGFWPVVVLVVVVVGPASRAPKPPPPPPTTVSDDSLDRREDWLGEEVLSSKRLNFSGGE